MRGDVDVTGLEISDDERFFWLMLTHRPSPQYPDRGCYDVFP